MEKRSVIHMFNPMPQNSPFDVNMAVDAGFDILVPYDNVELNNVGNLVQDAIFSRGPAGVKQTSIFIGGRDLHLALDMFEIAKKSMVPPFEVSVFADPSGAFTTAAAMVAAVEKQLKDKHGTDLQGKKAIVFGGTGPVGIATAVTAAMYGADITVVDHASLDNALEKASEYGKIFDVTLHGTCATSDADKARLIEDADVIFCAAKAGVNVLSSSVLKDAKKLLVAGDVNAVPPLGIEGLDLFDMGVPLKHATKSPGALGVGALAIGNVKYNLQLNLLKSMLESDKPIYIDFREAFKVARSLV